MLNMQGYPLPVNTQLKPLFANFDKLASSSNAFSAFSQSPDRKKSSPDKQQSSPYKKESKIQLPTPSFDPFNFNFMNQQLGWFKERNLYSALIKISIFALLAVLFSCLSLLRPYLLVYLTLFYCIHTSTQHRLITNSFLQKWVPFSIFPVLYHILTEILNTITKSNSFTHLFGRLEEQKSYCIVFTCILGSIYFLEPLLFNVDYHLTEREPMQIFYKFTDRLNYLGAMISHQKKIIFYSQAIAANIIILVNLDKFNELFQSYVKGLFLLLLLNVSTTLLILAFFSFQYFVKQPLFWVFINNYFEGYQKYTELPNLLVLLKINSVEDEENENQEEKKIEGIYRKYFPSHLKQTNNLTKSGQQWIQIHCLCWLIQLIKKNAQTIFVRREMFNDVRVNKKEKEVNLSYSYWDFFVQFSTYKLKEVAYHQNELQNEISSYQILLGLNKSFIQDILYQFRIKIKEIKILLKALRWAKSLKIIHYILQIIAIAQLDKDYNDIPELIQFIGQIKAGAQNILAKNLLNSAILIKALALRNQSVHILDKLKK